MTRAAARRRPAPATAVAAALAIAAATAATTARPATAAGGAHDAAAAGHADRVEFRDPATPPARGPSTALVTIEVFFVPGPNMAAASALRMLRQLQDRHPARIRVVYRVIKSGASLLVPSMALEAHTEGKFFELIDELLPLRSALKKDDLLELARKIGLDPQRVASATQLERYRKVLDANQQRLDRLHISAQVPILFNARLARLPSLANPVDLEREYDAAYGRALDKLDRGFAPDQLAQAFDDEAMAAAPPMILTLGSADDEDRSTVDHPLASPPLALDGLPSFGKPGAAVPIVILCRPNDAACSNLLRVVEPETRRYPDEVRIVWAPWFDVGRDDAAALSMLGDAALCAETIGSNQGELTTSPGWTWVREMYAQASRIRGRKIDAIKLIDGVAAKLDVDVKALSACRARMASTTLDWVGAARRSGVPRNTEGVVVVGGRIYSGLVDQTAIQQLVEAELSPGVLGSLPRWHTNK